MNIFFQEIAVLLAISSILAIIFKVLRQPTVLAYILAGLLLGAISFFGNESKEALHTFSELGITLLLFLLGLELKLGELKSVGKVSLFTGIGQIIFTTFFGFILTTILGFPVISSFYIAFGITFSSTIVIVKLLSDKKDLNSLYGKISIGFLLVQDFCAVVALVLLTSFGNGGNPDFLDVVIILLKAALAFTVIIIISQNLIPNIVHKISKNQEILFVSVLAWAFCIAAILSSPIFGFSIEIGGFLAGLALANSIETTHIVSKVKSLRDFFIVVFFVLLGAGMNFSGIYEVILPAIVLSTFILLGNPIIVMIILGLFGFRRRTSFMAGLTVAQISEFSIILLYLGEKLGHVGSKEVTMVTLIGMITFTLSTYLIMGSEFIYKKINRILKIFERKKLSEDSYKFLKDKVYDVVIIGAHRMGKVILENISEKKDKILVIEFNPDIVSQLHEDGFDVIFGDIADIEIQEKAKLKEAKLIISTLPDFEDNVILARSLSNRPTQCKLVVTAHEKSDAKDLRKEGVDKILMPYAFAGKHIGLSIKNNELFENL